MPALKLKYTGRKSEGTKLGVSVAKDLRKKVSSFFRKESQSHQDTFSLEIDLEGKDLTDDGLAEVCSGLQDALASQDGVSAYRLEELNLKANGLTTASLSLLVPIIKASAFDLRSLDLSSNNIRVHTSTEGQHWEEFLDSFRICRVLRRLDFSENDLSKSLGLEIFARVYFQHPPIDPNQLEGVTEAAAGSLASLTAVSLREKTNFINQEMAKSYDPTASVNSLSNCRILQRRAGLRSVPYIILRNIRMEDVGALHFSYVLASHYWPQYLMTPLKEGSNAAKHKEEDDVAGFGLVYEQSDSLTANGCKLLGFAESARKDLVGLSDFTESTNNSYVDALEAPTPDGRKVSLGIIRSPVRQRRSSIMTSSDSCMLGERRNSHVTDIESLRKKLQRTTVEDLGVHSVELWAAALRFLFYARILLPRLSSDQNHSVSTFASRMTLTPSEPPEPIFAITEESSTPSSLITIDFSRRPVSSISRHESLLNGGVRKHLPVQIAMGTEVYREPSNLGQLPDSLWRFALAYCADAHKVLSEGQQDAVIRYAKDRHTLAVEQQSQAKSESHQILKMLEGMGCLTYERTM